MKTQQDNFSEAQRRAVTGVEPGWKPDENRTGHGTRSGDLHSNSLLVLWQYRACTL